MVKIRFAIPAGGLSARDIGERKGEYSPINKIGAASRPRQPFPKGITNKKIVRQTTDFMLEMLLFNFIGLGLGLRLSIGLLFFFYLFYLLIHTVGHTYEHHPGLSRQEFRVDCLSRTVELI